MKNIFAKFQDYVKKPNRNTFDLSFYNNLTLKFGQLTPVFCKEVIPGDSFRINTAFGLQLMPMKFPVQTPMRAYIHYFYVRNRTLWKDWMDFIGGTKDNLVPPYIQPLDKKEFYRVGGIADYFGIPNVMYGSNSSSVVSEFDVIGVSDYGTTISTREDPTDETEFRTLNVRFYNFFVPNWVDYNFFHYLKAEDNYTLSFGTDEERLAFLQSYVSNAFSYLRNSTAYSVFETFNPNVLPNPYNAIDLSNLSALDDVRYIPFTFLGSFNYRDNPNNSWSVKIHVNGSAVTLDGTPLSVDDEINANFIVVCRDSANKIISMYPQIGKFVCTEVVSEDEQICEYSSSSLMLDAPYKVEIYSPLCLVNVQDNYSPDSDLATIWSSLVHNTKTELSYGQAQSESNTIVIYDNEVSPYGDSSPYEDAIHLNALPFRAYEAIYNAYYRNPQNNPFILNGTPEYNRYNTTYDGGADSTDYHLYFRNWEYDFLTSSVQSPQQGTAPLVGISVTGEATFQDEDGNTYYAQAILNDDGEITGWQSHSSNMPTGSLRLLMDMAGSGISINDLRNVNAFQRFLENNIRRGLKYRDQLMSHFGVKARYDELDMPEFIGGCSTSVNVNKLSQTSETGDTPLGSFVGQASAFGQSKHSITHYCDEHGFIIGIMSVVPVPVYSQLLPKFFTKSQQLDYYFPEFGHIGYQPIQQKEVSPLQTFFSGNDLNKVFGYNRAWYDYLASTDEVHGQFRTTMRDFLMNRTFESEPELSEEFLLVDPNQLNDVFLAGIDDDDIYAPESDKIIGSIYFDVSAKRPIPLFGIPKLTE